jgi:hypothetical protein
MRQILAHGGETTHAAAGRNFIFPHKFSPLPLYSYSTGGPSQEYENAAVQLRVAAASGVFGACRCHPDKSRRHPLPFVSRTGPQNSRKKLLSEPAKP